MKTFITQKQNWKKIVLGALATAIVAPVTTLSAQAAPPDNAPAYGYRDRDDKDKGNKKPKKNKVIRDRDSDGYDDRDRDRDGDFDEDDGYDYRDTQAYKRRYDETNTNFRDANRNGVDDREENDYRNGRSVTLTGTFVRDLPGNRFEMRASNGVNYQVMTRNNERLRLSSGQPVTVTGRIIGNGRFVIADRVGSSGIRDNINQNTGRVNFTATVTAIRSDRELTVRSDGGGTYTVRTADRLSSSFNRGDRVRITGRLRANVVEDGRVQLISSNGRDNDDNYNSNINFDGRVLSSGGSFGDRIFTVRADNGTTYRVRLNSNTQFANGDRVRVSGRLRNGVVEATRVVLLDGNNYDNDTLNFDGRVQSRSNTSPDRIILVRADNGTTYRVRLNSNTRFEFGDRVRVSGRSRNGVVEATRVVLIDGNNDNNTSGNIDFRGRVESSRSFLGQRILTVRADNGTTYRVRYTGNERYDNGDYVRVRGDLRNGVVSANDIDRL